MTRVRPHIMVHGGKAGDMIAAWSQVFEGFEATPPSDVAGLWTCCLAGQEFTLFDSPEPHEFGPTPSWSFLVDLDRRDDVDTKAAALAEGGAALMPVDSYPFAERFAWIEDRFGISWQLRFGAK